MRSRGLAATMALVALAAVPWPGSAKTQTPILLNRPRCSTATGLAAAGPKTTLRVATFNVLHGLEETPTYPTHSTLDDRLELGAQAIAAAGIDLIGMQEVSDTQGAVGHTSGLYPKRMATRLAQITGVSWHWCWNLSNPHFPVEPEWRLGGGGPLSDVMASMASNNYASFKEGSAVLSRYPIVAAEARRLPLRLPVEYVACPPADVPTCNETAIFDHRIAMWARVATPGGVTDITTTHLAHGITGFSTASKFVQAIALLEFSNEEVLRHGRPARRFITCDCNSLLSDGPSAAKLITQAGWTDTYAAANPTSYCAPGQDTSGCTTDQDILAPASTTTERIDYVFGRAGFCGLGLTASQTFADSPGSAPGHPYLWASDHHGVASDFTVGGCAAGY